MNDPDGEAPGSNAPNALAVRVALYAPVARGHQVELTFFAAPGLFGEVIHEAEPLVFDRTAGIAYLSDRFALPPGEPTPESIASASHLRLVRSIAGTVVGAVVVSPVVSNAPLFTEIRLVPLDLRSPYRRPGER